MDVADVDSLALTLGLGEIPPLLNEENQALHQRLISQQLRIAELEAVNEAETDDVGQLFSHLEAVSGTSLNAKLFIKARKEEATTEKGLETTARYVGKISILGCYMP